MKGKVFMEGIIQRAKSGDMAAVEELYNLNRGLIIKGCRRFNYDQQDLMQESFFFLIKAIAKYEEGHDCKFSSYLSKFLHWGLIKHLLQHRKHDGCISFNTPIGEEENTELLDVTPDKANSFDDFIRYYDITSTVHKALDTLDATTASVMWYIDGQGKAVKEVMTEMGISQEKLKHLRMYGRIRLKRNKDMIELWSEYSGTKNKKTFTERDGRLMLCTQQAVEQEGHSILYSQKPMKLWD